jgi:hypothetical protein
MPQRRDDGMKGAQLPYDVLGQPTRIVGAR